MSSPFIDSYDPLDIIGNGSFGVIRKVRRKADGMTFARKELNFEKMSERDRKQIVSEVNILKDLNHEHIVRYIDRYVDRDAGILYILMEYCGGGDLSSVIKLATKHNRPIPEDTIWNYFMQILRALQHCHHPNGHQGHARSNSSGGSGSSNGSVGCGTGGAGASGSGSITDGGTSCDAGGRDRKVQILHRDLKPDNVFLDENNTVKLGDFGLSKALAQASFANTYVGTPYYMSPELMQEKAYDSKSDIWSLGCLIYELCALKPPFHEAKTHAELSISIRNGRIPPLPRGYSQALSNVIKSMLSLNPAMRPSAAQLLQHERLELVFKVSETEKMLTAVKAHRATVSHKEREVLVREAALHEKERHLAALLAQKDAELASLQKHVAHIQHRAGVQRYTQQDVEAAVRNAVARREEELRVAVMRREEEVKAAMAKREEEIAGAVKKREMEVCESWARREVEITKEVEIWRREMEKREEELKVEEVRLSSTREELEAKVTMLEEWVKDTERKGKTPLEEVKNLLMPSARKVTRERRPSLDATPKATKRLSQTFPPIETPGSRAMFSDFAPSAMKGVVLTSTGEVLETPTPTEVGLIFKVTPKVGLNFAKIFEFGADESRTLDISAVSLPPSPSWRKVKERNGRGGKSEVSSSASSSSSSNTAPSTTSNAVSSSSAQPAAKTRRPSMGKTSSAPPAPAPAPAPAQAPRRTSFTRAVTVPVLGVSKKAKEGKETNDGSGAKRGRKSHSHSQPVGNGKQPRQREEHKQGEDSESAQRSKSAPQYDLDDEENLPSPFLKRDKVFCAFVDEGEEDLPSPFLKRAEREQIAVAAKGGNRAKMGSAVGGSVKDPSATTGGGSCAADATAPGAGSGTGAGTGAAAKKRPSNGNMLRAMAAANNVAGRRGTTPVPGPSSPTRASTARAAQIQADSHQPHRHQHHPGRPVLHARNGKALSRS
ncbi:hypothetical protein APHAL10511_001402 [Amanita phalloides]|nr:hypothetical protein APHAL10511_001402 [Amanita phalloides]